MRIKSFLFAKLYLSILDSSIFPGRLYFCTNSTLIDKLKKFISLDLITSEIPLILALKKSFKWWNTLMLIDWVHQYSRGIQI